MVAFLLCRKPSCARGGKPPCLLFSAASALRPSRLPSASHPSSEALISVCFLALRPSPPHRNSLFASCSASLPSPSPEGSGHQPHFILYFRLRSGGGAALIAQRHGCAFRLHEKCFAHFPFALRAFPATIAASVALYYIY